jgi:hypothetical protein
MKATFEYVLTSDRSYHVYSSPAYSRTRRQRIGGPKITPTQHPVEKRDEVECEDCEEIQLSMESMTTESLRNDSGCLFVGRLRTTGNQYSLVFVKFDNKTIGYPHTRAVFLFAGPHTFNATDTLGTVAASTGLTNQCG